MGLRLTIGCVAAFLFLWPLSAGRAAAPPSAGRGPTRLDRHGYPLPSGAIARLGPLRFRQGSNVCALAFSPDGKLLATGGEHLPLVLWDVATGRRLPSPSEPGSALALAFSSDGKFLAWGGNRGLLRLWDVRAGRVVRTFPQHQSFITAIAFSPDGKRIASGGSFEEFTIRVWEVSTGRERLALRGHERSIASLAFSPDGKLLASGSGDQTVRVWDAASGRELYRLRGHKGACVVAFSPDGKLLASGGRQDKGIRLRAAGTGKEVSRLTGIASGVRALAFAPDGKLLAVLDGQKLQLWAAATGKKVRELEGYADYVNPTLAWSRDGSMLAWPENNYAVRIWKPAGPFRYRDGHLGSVVRLAFSPDGKALASVGAGGTGGVLLWSTATWAHREVAGKAPSWPRIAFASGGKALVTAREGKVHWWETATGRPLGNEDLGESAGDPLAFSADGGTFVSNWRDEKGGLGIWQTRPGKTVCTSRGFGREAHTAAISPDGKALATGGRLYYRDGMLVSPSRDMPVLLWDLTSGKLRRRLEGHQGTIGELAFSPCGRWLASASGDVRVWSVAAGKVRFRLEPHVQALAFSADGRTLAGADTDGSIHLWETATGQERGRLEGQQGGVRCLAFSPDGAFLATGGEDTTILIWDVGGQEAAVLSGPDELERCWVALADGDARSGYRAIRALAASSKASVPFLRKHLAAAVVDPKAIEPKVIARLVKELDDESFAVRERATRALEALGKVAGPALRRALAARPSLELHRRAERLLGRLEKGLLTPEQLREVRAVEALERAGTDEARRLLKALGEGAAEARLTEEARIALRRLARRPRGGG